MDMFLQESVSCVCLCLYCVVLSICMNIVVLLTCLDGPREDKL